MNRSSKVPLLTKEGSGEVLERRVSNLPLAPSLVRMGFTGPTHQRSAGPVLRMNGKEGGYSEQRFWRDFAERFPVYPRVGPVISGTVSRGRPVVAVLCNTQ